MILTAMVPGVMIPNMPGNYLLLIEQSSFAHSCTRILRHMSVSPEMQQRIATLRQKSRDGTITQDEMREAIVFLRAERLAMPASSATKSRTAKPSISTTDLLSELDGL